MKALENRSILVPEDCAHGILTLEDNTDVIYLISQLFKPNFYAGVRYNDPAFQINWSAAIREISEKDANWPEFMDQESQL